MWEKSTGVYSEDGTLLCIEGGVTDVFDRRKAEEELEKIEKLKSIGTLAGGIAHDFNNILMGLFGNIALAKKEFSRNQKGVEYLEKAEKSINRDSRLTRQLLTFAKGGAPVKEVLTLPDLLEELVRFDLSGSNVKPVFHRAENLWMVKADLASLVREIGWTHDSYNNNQRAWFPGPLQKENQARKVILQGI
ncbi:MAG: histidine kinase dimerization/phospho-acceptor domain-containing protein [Desulfobacteraceae bacterium]